MARGRTSLWVYEDSGSTVARPFARFARIIMSAQRKRAVKQGNLNGAFTMHQQDLLAASGLSFVLCVPFPARHIPPNAALKQMFRTASSAKLHKSSLFHLLQIRGQLPIRRRECHEL